MSTGPIRLLVDFEIHEGKFEQFEAIAKQMAEVTEREPGTLSYRFYLSADRRLCRLLEGYVDQAAITAHFNGPAVQQFVPQLLHFCSPTRMDVYGNPGAEVIAMVTVFGARIYSPWEGFDR